MSDKNPTHGDRLDSLEQQVARLIHRLAVAVGLDMEDPPDTVLVEPPTVEPPAVALGLEPPGMYRDTSQESAEPASR